MKVIYDYTDEEISDMSEEELEKLIRQADEIIKQNQRQVYVVEYLWSITDWNKVEII